MRETVGATWIYQLVIVFILIFVAFLALTMNYTKAFKVKNDVLSIVEKYEGFSKKSISIINNYLLSNGYKTTNDCYSNEMGSQDLTSDVLKKATSGQKYYYCVSKIPTATETRANRAKYKIRIFFRFDLPVIGHLYTFEVDGTTIDITNSIDGDIPYAN